MIQTTEPTPEKAQPELIVIEKPRKDQKDEKRDPSDVIIKEVKMLGEEGQKVGSFASEQKRMKSLVS